MPPFLEFRLWLREGPTSERTAAGVAAAVVLAVVIAALVPVARGSGGGDQTLSTLGGNGQVAGSQPGAAGTAPGGAAGVGTSGATGAGGATGGRTTAGGSAGGTNGGTTGGGSTAAGCSGLGSSATGVTSTAVRLDMANISLAGPIGNSTFSVRPDMAKIANALAADINEHGGVACGRKLVLKQYDVNPLDANDAHAKCLQMTADHPFMVFNVGAYLTPADRQCFTQAKVLEQSATQIDNAEARASYPYLFSAVAVAEQMVTAALLDMGRRGIFKAPAFKKLGLFEDECDPPVNRAIDAALSQLGIGAKQISKYVLDCAVAAQPNQIEQGALQHKLANASHVFLASSETNDQNYVRIANGHQFHPQYLVSDYGANTSGSGTSNWGAPFNGAIGITTSRVGELSSGIHNAQEVTCDKVLRSHGVKGISSESTDTTALGYCDMFWIVRQALNRAGANPTQSSFLQAFGTMGLFRSVDTGDGNFNRAGKVTGGDFKREITYQSGCGCWKIVDRTMIPI